MTTKDSAPTPKHLLDNNFVHRPYSWMLQMQALHQGGSILKHKPTDNRYRPQIVGKLGKVT